MFIKVFGYTLAGGIILTSLLIALMGGRWQQVESRAYAGERRPGWFIVVSLVLVALYITALADFVTADKTWAGWLLVVVIPLGWLLKGAAVIFNQAGRQKVAAIAGDAAWLKVAAMRLPIAAALAGLASMA
jgi:cytochrome bd-type quinol oxidase subunit 2